MAWNNHLVRLRCAFFDTGLLYIGILLKNFSTVLFSSTDLTAFFLHSLFSNVTRSYISLLHRSHVHTLKCVLCLKTSNSCNQNNNHVNYKFNHDLSNSLLMRSKAVGSNSWMVRPRLKHGRRRSNWGLQVL